MQTSTTGRDFIKRWEGCKLQAYRPLPTDKWTIGYGHTLTAYEGMTITQEEAESLLISDLSVYERAVTSEVGGNVTQEQFDALVSFTFNVGKSAFKRSTLLRELKAGHYDRVGQQMKRWVNSGGKRVEGLVNRRNAEVTMFESSLHAIAQNTTPSPPKGRSVAQVVKKSKTVKGVGAVGLLAVADHATVLSGQATTVAANIGVEPSTLFTGGIGAGLLYLLYNRWNDSRQGRAY